MFAFYPTNVLNMYMYIFKFKSLKGVTKDI